MLLRHGQYTDVCNKVVTTTHPSGEMGATGKSVNHSMISALVALKGSPRSFSMPAQQCSRMSVSLGQLVPQAEANLFQ